MKAKRTVLSTLAQLRSGTGAQRLPVPPLRSLEIRGIPSAHADRAHRAFVKTVIPRIKYWNDDLDIRFEIAEASKRPSPSAAKAAPSSSESSSESPAAAAASLSAAPTSLVRPSILLHYDGLPTQELDIEGKSSSEIVRELQVLARTTAGTPLEEIEDGSLEGEDKGQLDQASPPLPGSELESQPRSSAAPNSST